jgi:hypothetical protein
MRTQEKLLSFVNMHNVKRADQRNRCKLGDMYIGHTLADVKEPHLCYLRNLVRVLLAVMLTV